MDVAFKPGTPDKDSTPYPTAGDRNVDGAIEGAIPRSCKD